MNDHNLDDLIIDNMEPKNGKAKSLLTIVALLIVVLIVAIIFTKIILKDPNEGKAVLEENDVEMISPELTLQNVTIKKEEKEETKLSTIIEKELNEPVKAPEVKEIVEPAETVQIEEEKAKVVEAEKPKVAEVKEKTTAPQSVKITKEFDQSPAVPEPKPEVKESPKVEEVAVPKTKPTPVQDKKPETITSVSGQIYYIQVGSFSHAPSASSRLLSSIKNNGFNYRIKTVGNTKKAQVGPFKDRASADTALVRIRDLINKSAFVVKK
jgi:cell division protein FtsN